MQPLVAVCEHSEIPHIVDNLKGYSSYKLKGAHPSLRKRPPLPNSSAGASRNFENLPYSRGVHSGINPAVHGKGKFATLRKERGAGLSSTPKRYYDGTIRKLWARGYNVSYIKDGEHLENTLDYIRSNHSKHHVPAIDLKLREAATRSLKQLENLEWF